MQDLAFRELVERVKLRSPIEEVVGARVEGLRRQGALFWARCPFHEERTASFAVDPRRGTWRCFGACGEGGDVLSFVQRFDALDFLDALRLLARACGEEVPERTLRARGHGDGGSERLDRLRDVLARAERFYAERLWTAEGAAALAYARGRGFSDETLRAFGTGWAPAEGSPLLESARASGVAEELVVAAGLVRRSDDSRSFDFFRGRWMLPIRDRLGRTVGFGGRHLPGDAKALGKYVNTPETELFHKGRLVYGMDLAADAVRRSRRLVLVEGYTDVMAAHQAGFSNVAAVLGTSTTEDHAALVRRCGASRVTLVFDGDEAGRQASLRALHGLLPLDLSLEVASPPDGADPCDLCLGATGGEAFGAMLEGARDWFAWLVDGLADLSGAELGRGVDELFGLLARLGRPVEQDARLLELARALELSPSAVRRQWEERLAKGRARAQARQAGPGGRAEARGAAAPPPADPALVAAFRSLLGAMLLDNSLIPVYGDWGAHCPDPDLQRLFRAMHELYEADEDGEPIHAGTLMTLLGDHPVRDRVVEIEHQARTAESPSVLARDQDAWLRRRLHEEELRELRHRLSTALPTPTENEPASEAAAQALLRDLHTKLREGRVPTSSR